MELAVYNALGKEVGKVAVDEKVLGEKVRRRLLHQAVVYYEANRRVGTHKTKSKAERHGSGVKPWKQKHTGRARVGTKRSPLWRGGGNIFGPRPRDYRQEMPVRMRREALKSALLSKLIDQQVKVIDALECDAPKTKTFAMTLKKLGLNETSCLAVAMTPSESLLKSARNIEKCFLISARNLNAYEVLKHKQLLFTKETVERLAEVVKV
jgi:large subunit ribosomal protein L4